MGPDRILQVLSALALRQASRERGRYARRAVRAWSALSGVRRAIAGDERAKEIAGLLLRAFADLEAPMRGYRRAHRKRCNGAPRVSDRKVSDAQIVHAVRLSPSLKVAAARLGIHRVTLARRLETLMMHPVHGASLAGVNCIQRSRWRDQEA